MPTAPELLILLFHFETAKSMLILRSHFFAQVSSAHLKQRTAFPARIQLGAGRKSYKGGVIYTMPRLMLKQPEDIRVWSGHLPGFALLKLLKVSLSSFRITPYKNFIKHSVLWGHPPLSVKWLPSAKGSCKPAFVSSTTRTRASVFTGKLKATALAWHISCTTVHTDLCCYSFFWHYTFTGISHESQLCPSTSTYWNTLHTPGSGLPTESGLQDSASV